MASHLFILTLVLTLFQLVIFHVSKGPFYEEFYQCVTYGFYTEPWQEQLYTTFSLVCMFILPLVILISTYVSTIVTISRSEKMFRAEVASGGKYAPADVNRRRLIHRAKMKSLRISVVIVMAFIVWWTPYYTMMIIFMFLNPDKHLSEDLQSGIFFFGMSNSLVNPVIYGAFHLWQPRKRRMGSCTSDYRNSYRESGLQRRSTASNATTIEPRVGSRTLRGPDRAKRDDENTTLMAMNEVDSDAKRFTSGFTQRYSGVLISANNRQSNF
ncbi:gonadotropin-releasing hormone receptor [Anabrus simplex]|uniref:gonadotropin-releasing hormone receptor n=1 Tax=Anabrus simplex TaxID=316456 RepID=UPI0035A34F8B